MRMKVNLRKLFIALILILYTFIGTECNNINNDCYSLLGLVAAIAITMLLILTTFAIMGTVRRRERNMKF